MAYARELLAVAPERLQFAAVCLGRFYGRLKRHSVLQFLDATEERWRTGGVGRLRRLAFGLKWLARLSPRPLSRRSKPCVYLQASPHHLDRRRLVRRILAQEHAKWIVLAHDVIPITYAEYARQDGAERHRARLDTMCELAAAIVTNSHATALALTAHMQACPRRPSMLVAHLGTRAPAHPVATPYPSARPYFIIIGTIEPRKNHLLLLNLWRRMAETLPSEQVPILLIIGRRGWENENVVDMLERCVALRGHVREVGAVPDYELDRLLAGARALLMPSFAEGYGMPIAEALQARVPVICSDLPAHREAGGPVPDYIDPLDGRGWLSAIHNYTLPNADARVRQLHRLQAWRPPEWREHVLSVLRFAEEEVDDDR